ncbi:unnamed protein product [Strongylus vulgaris]|uniref:Uncharacterized protein n=1 Tax=Strongylus vulgaris TaxID=40348 RepID=A0A3P7I7V7_STRVU|nr:unnamed protein product [Strongylus vulgaris]
MSEVILFFCRPSRTSLLQSASGSADSSGFGSVPNSPLDFKSLGRKSLRKTQKLPMTSPRLIKKFL